MSLWAVIVIFLQSLHVLLSVMISFLGYGKWDYLGGSMATLSPWGLYQLGYQLAMMSRALAK